VVGGNLHCLLQLDVKLCSGENLAYPSDIVLKEVFVQGLRGLEPADEYKCIDVFTIVGDFGELNLKESYV